MQEPNTITMLIFSLQGKARKSYTTPVCKSHAIEPEGPLCVSITIMQKESSIEQLKEYDTEYQW